MSPVFVTAPFLVQKVLKTANSEKFVFSCQTASGVPQPLDSLGFGRKQAPDAHFALDSVFCPEKQASFIPLSLSPLVTASSPLSFGPKKCAKAAKFPSSRGLRSSQGFPFFAQARQPAEVLARDTATCRTCRRLCQPAERICRLIRQSAERLCHRVYHGNLPNSQGSKILPSFGQY